MNEKHQNIDSDSYKNKLIKNFKIRKRLIKIGFLVNQIYKESIIFKGLSSFIFIIMQYYVWKSIYSTNSIDILSFKSMFTYIILAQIIANIYPMNVSSQIGSSIRTGNISLTLLNPYSYIEQLFFESVGSSFFKLIILNIPIYILYIVLIGINISMVQFLQFIGIFSLSYVLYFMFELIFGVLSFYTTSQWGLQSLKYATIMLLSGRAIPIDFYPSVLRKIFDFLPFKYMYNTPILIFIGKEINFFNTIIIQIVYLAIFFIIYKATFNKAIRRLTIQGG
ncbi:MAG: ABC transporter permease [Filifactoraceae bacterium]